MYTYHNNAICVGMHDPALCQVISTDTQRKAKLLLRTMVILVLRSVTVLWDLLLSLYTSHVENNPLLSLLSNESSSRSKEGCGCTKITPQLLNETFLVKAT